MSNCQKGASENLIPLVATADRMLCQVWCVVGWLRPAAKHPQFAHSFSSHSGNGKKIRRTRMRKLTYQNEDHSPITSCHSRLNLWISYKAFNCCFEVWGTKTMNIWTLRKDAFSLPIATSTSVQTPLLSASQFLSFHCSLHSFLTERQQIKQAPGASV